MFRDPDLAGLERKNLLSSSDIPISRRTTIATSSTRSSGRVGTASWRSRAWAAVLIPKNAKLVTLFDASLGIARDPTADFDAKQVYFAYRPNQSPTPGQDCYWHLMSVGVGGG